MSLTINQEKQIRKQRLPSGENVKTLRRGADVDFAELALLRELPRKVALYRRAQRITTKEGQEARKGLLTEIDALLEKLGITCPPRIQT